MEHAARDGRLRLDTECTKPDQVCRPRSGRVTRQASRGATPNRARYARLERRRAAEAATPGDLRDRHLPVRTEQQLACPFQPSPTQVAPGRLARALEQQVQVAQRDRVRPGHIVEGQPGIGEVAVEEFPDLHQEDLLGPAAATPDSRDSYPEQFDRHPAGGLRRRAVHVRLRGRDVQPRPEQSQVHRVRQGLSDHRGEVGDRLCHELSRHEHRVLHEVPVAEGLHRACPVPQCRRTGPDLGGTALLRQKLQALLQHQDPDELAGRAPQLQGPPASRHPADAAPLGHPGRAQAMTRRSRPHAEAEIKTPRQAIVRTSLCQQVVQYLVGRRPLVHVHRPPPIKQVHRRRVPMPSSRREAPGCPLGATPPSHPRSRQAATKAQRPHRSASSGSWAFTRGRACPAVTGSIGMTGIGMGRQRAGGSGDGPGSACDPGTAPTRLPRPRS